jgi:hypothetical protein
VQQQERSRRDSSDLNAMIKEAPHRSSSPGSVALIRTERMHGPGTQLSQRRTQKYVVPSSCNEAKEYSLDALKQSRGSVGGPFHWDVSYPYIVASVPPSRPEGLGKTEECGTPRSRLSNAETPS